MANETLTRLPSELIEELNGEKLVLLGTIESDSNTPNITAISWVKCMDENTIRFSISSQSRLVNNIVSQPAVTLCFFAKESVYSITGKAMVLEKTMEQVAIPLAKIEVSIEGVYPSMFWGSKITQEPVYEKTYNVEKAKKLDHEVFIQLIK